MIRVEVFEASGRIARFSVSGHAGFAKAGRDIVCAAVSALTLNAVNSCEKFLDVRLPCEDNGATLICEVPLTARDSEVQLLLRSMVFGLEQTQTLYPAFVRVVHRRAADDNGA